MIPCPRCGGLLLPQGELQDRAWCCDDCGRLHLEGAVAMDYALPRPAWWGQATGNEVLAFGLSAANLPDGSGIPGLDDPELRRLLAMAEGRLRSSATRSGWLLDYTARLVAEARARKGAA